MPHFERRRLPWIAAGIAVLVAVTVLGIVHARTHRAPGTTTAGDSSHPASAPSSTAAPPARQLPVGITFGGTLFGAAHAKLAAALDDVVTLHMSWIRVDFSWAALQPKSASSYDWRPMDAIVDAAQARHLHVLGLLTYTPKWARAAGCTTFVCPPRDDAQFAHFAAAVVDRYRGKVSSYQIWNEPNIDLFWRHPDAVAYGRLLTTTVSAMRKSVAQLRILFGGLAFTSTAGSDISPTRFLVDACANRTCDVDAIGYDPFTYPSLPSAPSANAWPLISDSTGFPAALARAGLAGKPIWITEFGAPTDFPGSTDPRTVSERQQAAIVVDGLRLAQQNAGAVGAYFIDTWRDAKQAGTTRDHFGVERYDGTHKPAFGALENALVQSR